MSFFQVPCVLAAEPSGIDETEGVIAIISSWLELDAADDWVRHDSEIVSRMLWTATFPSTQNSENSARTPLKMWSRVT
jgi:protein arginine N-methyltransferase 5